MNLVDPPEIPRWQNYVLERGSGTTEFWSSHLEARTRNLLFIMGRGFDPRMCHGLEVVIDAAGKGKRDVIAVTFEEGPSSPSRAHTAAAAENWSTAEKLVHKRGGQLSSRTIKMLSDDGRRIGSRNAGALIGSSTDIAPYTDIVVDISAMPRAVYFPLIAKLLYLVDDANTAQPPNIHVLVAENPSLDKCIRAEGVDDKADYVYGFRGRLEMEATVNNPKVWIPLLGEGQGIQLTRIYDLIIPDEICAVLPSPSINPRRGDDLVLEYRDILFDRLRIEPRNFIYVSEWNPFEAYRQIRRAVLHYRDALRAVGGFNAVLSALSTKLMSLAALLVAYELKQTNTDIGIAHVESQGHTMTGANSIDIRGTSELCQVWLAGECYAS